MSFASRVYGMLELELSRRLSFSIRTPKMPGREPRPPRMNSNHSFSVWLRNNADFPLRTIRGTIQPTRCTRFQPVSYSVSELRPGQSVEIATVEALIVGRPARGSVLDQLALVNVSAAADLSTVTFQEWDRPVGVGATEIRPSEAGQPLPLSANPSRFEGPPRLEGVGAPADAAPRPRTIELSRDPSDLGY